MSIRCLFGHEWIAMKWGVYSELDCRRCRRCDRFQIVTFGNWYTVNQDAFPDARKPLPSEPPDSVR